MLNLYFGEFKDAVPTSYFDARFRFSWMNSEFTKRVIREVDKSEVLTDFVIRSPVLGSITPHQISHGSKALIMLKFRDVKMKLEYMGENCFKILKEICDEKEVYLSSTGYRSLFKDGGFTQIRIMNSGKIVTCPLEMFEEFNEVF